MRDQCIKKVLFIANSAKVGGGNLSLLKLTELLKAKGVNTLTFVPGRGKFTDVLEQKNIKFVIQKTQFHHLTKLQVILALFKALFIVFKFRPTLIHANDIHCYKYFDILAKITAIPIICHMRHFNTQESFDFLVKYPPAHMLFNSAYNKTKTDHAIKTENYENVEKSVVYNQFSKKDYFLPGDKSTFREQFNLPRDKILVCVIGNINPLKGHIKFVKAASYIIENNKGLNVQFLIAGEDVTNSGIENECKQLVEDRKLTDNIIFLGFIKDTKSLYAAIDILVIPSEEEPFGRIAVEGILANKKIVAHNNSGLKEILGGLKTPILYDDNTELALAQAILQAATCHTTIEDIQDDVNNIDDKFSKERQLNQLFEIYIKVAKSN